ncbi:MAG: succinate--CoA ligase subunit alpha [Candidatus Caenarcaniphilales bacterium]|nr:succinate--CoA ligase subunit alpha [Candidatus Caenarcaniphilales bacterium]
MSVLLNKDSKIIVQGATGGMGSTHTQLMLNYGTKVVAGVTPGKGGAEVHGVPVYNTVVEAIDKTGADVSVLFVPPLLCKDAALEAICSGGIRLLIIITEGIPPLDEVKIQEAAKQAGVLVVGPNCPGVITPGECLVGIHPGSVYKPGRIGMVSRSGTLTYEVALSLTNADLGQSTCVGIGGDPVPGLGFVETLKLFENDPETDLICLMGEIGGTAEESAAELIESGEITKPVIAYIAGRTAPEGKRMGHAGAIISGDKGTVESKEKAFTKAGVKVAKLPSEMVELVKQELSKVAA